MISRLIGFIESLIYRLFLFSNLTCTSALVLLAWLNTNHAPKKTLFCRSWRLRPMVWRMSSDASGDTKEWLTYADMSWHMDFFLNKSDRLQNLNLNRCTRCIVVYKNLDMQCIVLSQLDWKSLQHFGELAPSNWETMDLHLGPSMPSH